MYPQIATIYSIPIYSYGTAIVIGLMMFIMCIRRDPYAPSAITADSIDTITLAVIGASFLGGKIPSTLSLITSTHVGVINALLYSSLSITASVIAGTITAIGMIRYHHLPVYATLDLFARHAPIVHIWGRIGCFLAGCCYGCTTNSALAVTYTDVGGWAPLYIPTHPVQIYLAVWHIGVLTVLWGITYYVRPYAGTITALYISLFAIGRCIFDIFRADYTPGTFGISLTQGISIAVLGMGITWLLGTGYYGKQQL